MRSNKTIIASILFMLLGVTLAVLNFAEIVDSYWGGMGSAFIAVGIVRLIQFIRLQKNADYREQMRTDANDERNRFLRNKAWAWAGYFFVLVAAVLSIGLKLLGQDLLSVAAGLAVCCITLFYWVSYLVLRKKY